MGPISRAERSVWFGVGQELSELGKVEPQMVGAWRALASALAEEWSHLVKLAV